METATMTSLTPSLPLSILGETKATDAEIDAYATRVLVTMSPSESTFIDDSLGPYVASLLRCADIQDKSQVTALVEFDSILELLEDQCTMDRKMASDCILLIADAVITHVLPFSERKTTPSGGRNSNFGLYAQQGGDLCFLQSMTTDFSANDDTIIRAQAISPLSKIVGRMESSTPVNVGGPSPLKPDSLIPIDLMGELDDPSPDSFSPPISALHMQNEFHEHTHILQQNDTNTRETKRSPQINVGQRKDEDEFPPLGTSPEAFPPLGASSEKPKKGRNSRKLSHGKSQQHSDKDLAATLFRPARPRQNSVESEDAASRSRGSSNASSSLTTANCTLEEGRQTNNIYFQQQLNSCVEILLSINLELSEEAATAAGLMANTDFNLAQHILDSAMSAPPICRHMLNDGCYRSDCTFSHDVEGHTCLFWLRGRCGKGNACKFKHGFHEKLLNGIDTLKYHAEQQGCIIASSPGSPQVYSLQDSSQPVPSSSSKSFSSTMNVGFGKPFSPMLSSSWQTTPLVETASIVPSSSDSIPFSFANIASRGYEKKQFSEASSSPSLTGKMYAGKQQIPTVRIPQDLWNPHENRDASVFYIQDPLKRYQRVANSAQRSDVIDLHFQSIKTFPVVLERILPLKLNKMEANCNQVWIITGTGHHVGSKTHQKGGGALESAVISWLVDHEYEFSRGKDKNGLGGALLVSR
mmetsp:Transcript_6481/g.16015  ORF Transcript_6481/g.16015 Transcript_6481/m.16015 type:complete len:697 (+) Transcript_6481:269-2359(+)